MNYKKHKVLIVDDEPDILELVGYILEKEGMQVVVAANGLAGLEMAKTEKPDLIILDVMMPDMDGIEVCLELRQMPEFQSTLITFLTARNEDYSQIAGFEAGADDYITKPIRPKTLIARIKALLKRKRTIKDDEGIVEVNGVKVDIQKRLVTAGSKTLELPKKEFDLLLLLISEPGKVFSREYIYNQLWKGDIANGDRTIDVHIRKIRNKIGDECIITLKGIGYRFNS